GGRHGERQPEGDPALGGASCARQRPFHRQGKHLAGRQAAGRQPADDLRADAPARPAAMTIVAAAGRSRRRAQMINNTRPRARGFLVLVLALVSMLALARSPGAAAATSESEQHHAQAQGFMAKGDWQSALIELKNAVQADPDNAAARFDLGLVYLRLGDPPSAEKELREARDHGFDEKRIWTPM